MKVQDVMTKPAILVSIEDSCLKAAQLMRDHQAGALVVTTKEGVVQGIITDRDLVVRCMALGGDPAQRVVGDYCDIHPTMVGPEYELERALDIMRNAGIRRLPVVKGANEPVGMLSLDDIADDVKHYVDAFATVVGQYSRT